MEISDKAVSPNADLVFNKNKKVIDYSPSVDTILKNCYFVTLRPPFKFSIIL